MPRILTLNESGAIRRLAPGQLPASRSALELTAQEFDRLRLWDERTAGGREGHMVFAWATRQAAPNGYVGVIQHRHLLIELLPKLTRVEDPDAVALAQRNVQAMLAYALGLKHRHTGDAAQQLGPAPLSQFLIERFALTLREELGYGISHGYQQREELLGVLRGRLDLRAHLAQPGARKDRFAVRHEVFVHDTPLNQALLAACVHMMPLTLNLHIRQALGECVALLDGVRAVQPEQLRWETPFTDRTSERFAQPLLMARMLLQGLTPSGQAGEDELFTLLYRMDSLYERFVAGFLEREVVPQLTEPGEAPIRLVTQGGKPRRYLFEQPKTGELKPDLMLVQGERRLVLDTKWKPLSAGSGEQLRGPARFGVAMEDLYQLVVYGYAFDSQRVVLVYPDPDEEAVVETRYTSRIKLDGSQDKISVETLLWPLHYKIWRAAERRALADTLVTRLGALWREGAAAPPSLLERVCAQIKPLLPEGFILKKTAAHYAQIRHKDWPSPLHYELLERQGGRALRVDLHNELSRGNTPAGLVEALDDLLEQLEPVMKARWPDAKVERERYRKKDRKPNWLSIQLEQAEDEERLVMCMEDLIDTSRHDIITVINLYKNL